MTPGTIDYDQATYSLLLPREGAILKYTLTELRDDEDESPSM